MSRAPGPRWTEIISTINNTAPIRGHVHSYRQVLCSCHHFVSPLQSCLPCLAPQPMRNNRKTSKCKRVAAIFATAKKYKICSTFLNISSVTTGCVLVQRSQFLLLYLALTQAALLIWWIWNSKLHLLKPAAEECKTLIKGEGEMPAMWEC